jgi:urea transport system ATP-binding protein
MLKVENLSVSYGAVEALSAVNFSMERGSVLAVMGRNGVGKTTLMKSLVGLLKARTGEIYYEGAPLGNLQAYHRVRKGIGYVPQGRQIFPKLTVEENLMTGQRKRGQAIPKEIYDHFPVLRDMRNRRGGDLSGGQQQQLAIGRALVTNPKLLILDEPTEGIQPNIIQRIGEVLQILSKERGMTIVIVEQYLAFIREFSSHFLLMNKGSVVTEGETANLTSDHVEEYLRV